MANSLTYKGEEHMLIGDGSDGSIARLATAIKLMKGTSVPRRDGTGFVEVDNGNGYTTGGQAVVIGDWTYDQDLSQIVLNDVEWTASGGSIVNIIGAYLTDTGGNVLAWWERSLTTLAAGEILRLDNLSVKLG
jgi:hypothetical protein